MNYIVYKTTNKINSKIYIGVHSTEDPNVFDGYLGCACYVSKPSSWHQSTNSIFPKAVIKYGPHNFFREIIAVFEYTEEGRKLAYKLEEEIVTEEFIKLDTNYNIRVGGLTALTDPQKKKVDQFDINGEFIKTWDSIKEAEHFYNIRGQISKVVRGKHKTAKNYQWRYHDLNIKNLAPINIIQTKTVYQFDLSGNLIKVWKSISDASKQFGGSNSDKSSIKRVCEGYSTQSKGFFWSFKHIFLYKPKACEIPVACYTENGEFVKSYSSVKEACEELNISTYSNITSAIQGKHKFCKNLRWRYFYGNTSNIKPLT